MNEMKRLLIMNEIGIVRNKLENLIAATGSLGDSEVISLSQGLDKLISQYYLYKI